MLKEVGRAVAGIHDGGLVHGDLTTSNLLLRSSDKALVRPSRHAGPLHCPDTGERGRASYMGIIIIFGHSFFSASAPAFVRILRVCVCVRL